MRSSRWPALTVLATGIALVALAATACAQDDASEDAEPDAAADRQARGAPTARLSFSGDPAWSPDGQKIAFSSERDDALNIYVMNADGSDVARLTDNSTGGREPAWSPDGRKIAFASDRHDPAKGSLPVRGDSAIYAMNADGSGVARLTNRERAGTP